MIITDSNIWSYYFDQHAPEHRLVVEPIEERMEHEEIVVNTVILIEVAHFLVKNLGPVEGMEKVNDSMVIPTTIVDLDYALTTKAIGLLAKYSHAGSVDVRPQSSPPPRS